MTDCQSSLFFCLAVIADSWIFWVYFPILGSHRSAVKEHTVRAGLITLWGEMCESPLQTHFSLACCTDMREREITLSEEYFHSSTLSMLFLLVNLGLAPMEKNKQVNELYRCTISQIKHGRCSFLFPAAACHVSISPMMPGVDMWCRQTTKQTIWIRVCLPTLQQREKCRTWVWVSAQRRVHERKHHTKVRLTVQGCINVSNTAKLLGTKHILWYNDDVETRQAIFLRLG